MKRGLPSCVIAIALGLTACGPRIKDPGDDGALVSIVVEPENAVIRYTGSPSSVEYVAYGVHADGSRTALEDATFAIDDRAALLGAMSGVTFTAMGYTAGRGTVYAQRGDLQGSTGVAVQVDLTDLGPGVPPGAESLFPEGAALDPQLGLLYPLDRAVMPTSVKAPVVQWENRGAPGELYRVRMVAGDATVTTILSSRDAAFAFATTPTTERWQLLKSSANGRVEIGLDRWDAATGAARAPGIAIELIQADITGAIYYWNLSSGRMERIDAAGRAPAIANPPAKPSAGAQNNRCVACHAVSRDGRYLSGSLWGGGLEGAVFDLTLESVRTGDPAPTMSPLVENNTYRQLFSTFNPDASRLLVNDWTRLYLLDPKTGSTLPTNGTPLPTSGAAHPSWSPDGTLVALAYNVRYNGQPASWAVTYDHGDLAVMSAGPGDTFGDVQVLVPSAAVDPAFRAPSWPTFTPDSQWIAYGAGVDSRGRDDSLNQVYPGALFLIGRNGGTPQILDTACNGQRDCHLPNFSPFDSGTHFWLVFYSTRDYGNAQVGTKGSHRRQLWVTAIDKSKLGTGDASSVAYWLPDQDVSSANMSAFWAAAAPIQ